MKSAMKRFKLCGLLQTVLRGGNTEAEDPSEVEAQEAAIKLFTYSTRLELYVAEDTWKNLDR